MQNKNKILKKYVEIKYTKRKNEIFRDCFVFETFTFNQHTFDHLYSFHSLSFP